MKRPAFAALMVFSLLAPLAQASDSHGASASASAAAKAKAKKKKLAELSDAERLYEEYKEFDLEAERSKACLMDPHCKQPEDGVLNASKEAARVLDELAKRARKGDNDSAFYLGLVMYDQARLLSARAGALREDPALKTTYNMLVKRAQSEYERSTRYLAQASRAGEPEACMRFGAILAEGLGGQTDKALAYKLFRCAALGFLEREQRIKATDAYLRMLPLSDPRDLATAEVYSKLRPEEPRSPWRKPTRTTE